MVVDPNSSSNKEEEKAGHEAEEDANGCKHEGQPVADGQLKAWTQRGTLAADIHIQDIQNLKPQHVHHHHAQQEQAWQGKNS